MAADHQGEPRSSLGTRLTWFGLLWLAGVASVGAVSLLIKWALK
jgi:hypothetical protein